MDLTDFYGIRGSEVKDRARGWIFVGPSRGWIGHPSKDVGGEMGCLLNVTLTLEHSLPGP